MSLVSMMSPLVQAAAPWKSLFSHSAPVEMSVVATHVLSMFVAGGLAIAHDRGTLRASRRPRAIRDHHMTELHAVHRVVVGALAICMFSGLALFASDIPNYFVSTTFWIKMGLIVLLLVNALVMTGAENTLRASAGGDTALAWSRIRVSSIASALLWASIVVVSIVLSLSK